MSNADFLAYVTGRGASFSNYAAGRKKYGSGRNAPNVGPVRNRRGYKERDAKAKSKRAAMLRRLKAGQSRRYMSSDYLSPESRSR